jgi:hypothetical protein
MAINIIVPQELTYAELKSLLNNHYYKSLTSPEPAIRFDWAAVQRVRLPEVISILNWSSKLAQLKKSVLWSFRDPSKPIEGIEWNRSNARQIIGDNTFEQLLRQLNRYKKELLREPKFPHVRQKEVERILKNIQMEGSLLNPIVQEWVEAEIFPLNYMDLLGFLERYKVFSRALESGIQITPSPDELPKSKIAKSEDTPALELQPIQSRVEVGVIIEVLRNPQQLERILGNKTDLDVVRRGALAHILVKELGINVEEHSEGTAAWLCTRLVPKGQLAQQTKNDPAISSFRKLNEAFLEIIVCDNGRGLTAGLDKILNDDGRVAVKIKYKRDTKGNFPEEQLIDYAFDRLSSTKRDISQLVHLNQEADEGSEIIASGLYWIWNIVRSHQGLLSIRTANCCTWYDFTSDEGAESFEGWTKNLEIDTESAPFCGTMFRICLPLVDKKKNISYKGESNNSTEESIAAYKKKRLPLASIKSLWIGDLARTISFPSPKESASQTLGDKQRLLAFADTHENLILKELQKHHMQLKDGDILLLDLCGMRSKWDKEIVAPICHFFLGMNYTSTAGRSAVVLWNIPESAAESFEKGIKLAGRLYSHLRDVRRSALIVFEDLSLQFFCGWPEAEQALQRFEGAEELDIDNLLIKALSEDDRRRLTNLILENSHLFDRLPGNRVRLRLWPVLLRNTVWAQGLTWFKGLLGKSVTDGGVRLTPPKGYFRLPSGNLAKEFYQFSVALSHHESCARIAWLIAQAIRSIQKTKREEVVWVVSVTRPTMALAEYLVENYLRLEGHIYPQALAAGTIEELEAIGRERNGAAVFITDVISTGSLCDDVKRALPYLKWLGTIALLDTSVNASSANQIDLDYGINIYNPREAKTGPIYALSCKAITKTPPIASISGPITAIDRVNICPVQMQTGKKHPDADLDIWDYLDRKQSAVKVGHYYAGAYHHYPYYINARELLDATDRSGESLLHSIVEGIVRNLDSRGYDPNKTVIIHPPSDTSDGEYIGKRVQELTGALYRHILYRDNFAGQWRFSPFAQHGVPLDGCTVILIDDGANTGDTLMGLLDAATFGRPTYILACVGITRMPPHKAHLLRNLTKLTDVSKKVEIKFSVGLGIPVYSPRSCPVCKFRSDLSRIEEHSPLLWKYANQMKRETQAIKGINTPITNQIDATNLSSDEPVAELERDAPRASRVFLWRYTSRISVLRLREALELLDYHEDSSELVMTLLNHIVIDPLRQETRESLLDLGFVIALEPEISAASIFRPHLKEICNAALSHLEDCAEEELMTFTSLAFHFMVRLIRRGMRDDCKRFADSLWISILRRQHVPIHLPGRVITFALSEALTEKDLESGPYKTDLCQIWLKQLRKHLKEQENKDTSLTKAFAHLFIREAYISLQQADYSSPISHINMEKLDLYEQAMETASKFWRHSSDYIKESIGELKQCSATAPPSGMLGPLHGLVLAFDDLNTLQQSLNEAEKDYASEKSGTEIYWGSPILENTMASFIQSLASLAEIAENSNKWDRYNKKMAKRSLEVIDKAWENLYGQLTLAFDEIFPEVWNAVYERWRDVFDITGLPRSAASIIIDESLRSNEYLDKNESPRVFFPRILLLRFMNVAMQNLRTAAFQDWSEEELNNDARARIEIKMGDTDGKRIIRLRVVDNGMLHRPIKTPFQKKNEGQRRGLRDIKRMAKVFGASLIGPQTEGSTMVVELQIRYPVWSSETNA